MKLDTKGYDLIKGFEGLSLIAYLDSAKIPTIGYGNTRYIDGSKVRMGEKITQSEADRLFQYYADRFASDVDSKITVPIGQNQFNALVSLAYNIGIDAFSKSTLLKRVNACPTDPDIAYQFSRWVNAGGKRLQGLINRRNKEADLYFTKN